MTAVEWLEINLPDMSKIIGVGLALELTAKIQKAKEIEKEQIVNAFNLGQQKEAKQEFWPKGEQYYNETFSNKGD